MLNMHIPTIENYSEAHADWYKGFSTAFNLSQLSNYLFLSYLTTQVSQNTPILKSQPEYRAGLKECQNSDDHEDLLNSIDIFDMLTQIAADFAATGQKHDDVLFYRGLSIQGYHDKDVKIDLNEILNSTTEKNWNRVIRGLVNVFEFQYLFSVTEDHLKVIVKQENAKSVVGKALKDKPGIIEHFNTEYKLPRNFIIKLWEFYVEVRNIYAHSFGYINEKDKECISKKREEFLEAHEKLPIEWHLLNNDWEDDFFNDEKIVVGKMYLISVSEICIFKNFVRMFIPELSRWEKRESLETKQD
ncbi:hypothetical protein [Pseudomonas putida]|uniref:hypothetical protein n=1 Tax=Pseudomonas putida TaxID=303 RepID=UPI0033066F2A